MISSRFRMVPSPSSPAGFETVTRPAGTRYAVTRLGRDRQDPVDVEVLGDERLDRAIFSLVGRVGLHEQVVDLGRDDVRVLRTIVANRSRTRGSRRSPP